MGRLFGLIVAAALLSGSQAGAQARQTGEIRLKRGAPLAHAHSKLQFPPAVGSLTRGRAQEYEAGQLDMSVDYSSPSPKEFYTIYIFRRVTGGVPVWFDRARLMLEESDALGRPALHRMSTFVPPGRTNESGLIATYDLTGKTYRSTGLALVPFGDWYVKLRASSTSLGAGELEGAMKAALSQIGWPKKMGFAAAAAPVEACRKPLSFNGEAKRVEGEDAGATSMLDAIIGLAAVQAKPKATIREPRWCRDPVKVEGGGVYRADEDADRYLLAVADAGRGIGVGRSVGQLLLAEDGQPPKSHYTVDLVLMSETRTSAPYDRMPTPAQALAIVNEGRFATAVPTFGKAKGNIIISDQAIK